MTDPAPPARTTLKEALLAIDLFLNGGASAKEAVDAARPPEPGLEHDGETWSSNKVEHG